MKFHWLINNCFFSLGLTNVQGPPGERGYDGDRGYKGDRGQPGYMVWRLFVRPSMRKHHFFPLGYWWSTRYQRREGWRWRRRSRSNKWLKCLPKLFLFSNRVKWAEMAQLVHSVSRERQVCYAILDSPLYEIFFPTLGSPGPAGDDGLPGGELLMNISYWLILPCRIGTKWISWCKRSTRWSWCQRSQCKEEKKEFVRNFFSIYRLLVVDEPDQLQDQQAIQ